MWQDFGPVIIAVLGVTLWHRATPHYLPIWSQRSCNFSSTARLLFSFTLWAMTKYNVTLDSTGPLITEDVGSWGGVTLTAFAPYPPSELPQWAEWVLFHSQSVLLIWYRYILIATMMVPPQRPTSMVAMHLYNSMGLRYIYMARTVPCMASILSVSMAQQCSTAIRGKVSQ